MFKDTVEDAVCYVFLIAEPRPTFGPKEQYISGVCNYLLLTMCQVYHCIIRVFSHYLSRCLRDGLCGLLVTLRICYMVRRRAVLSPIYLRWNLSRSCQVAYFHFISKIPLGQFLSTHTKVQFDRGVWGWLAGCGGDGNYWVCSHRRVRCTECGCGYSFLRILNAEPVHVAPRLTIGSWLPLCAAPSVIVHRFIFFVIYFFLFYLFLVFLPISTVYTCVCNYFLFSSFLFQSWTCVFFSLFDSVQSRLGLIEPDISSSDTQPKFCLFLASLTFCRL